MAPTKPNEQNDIAKALKERGIKYSHHNDTVLAPNPLEEERAAKSVQVIYSNFGRARHTLTIVR
jgi:phosphohistidine phosphatase SixA